MRSVFDGLLEESGGRARYEVVDFAPSGAVDLDHPLLKDFISRDLDVRPKQAWTDVAQLRPRRRRRRQLRPRPHLSGHQQNEYVELSLLLESYERLSTFLSRNRD